MPTRRIDPRWFLQAYAQGYFPMAESRRGPMAWYSADPRAIIPLEGFHLPRRVARIVRQERFEVRIDTAFRAVITACADRPSTWISKDIIAAYVALHELGWTHSVETWRDGRLVGGLYGVALGGAFLAESMFHCEPHASNVALAHLVERLRAREFALLDVQIVNPHTERFGAVEIPLAEFRARLHAAIGRDCCFA